MNDRLLKYKIFFECFYIPPRLVNNSLRGKLSHDLFKFLKNILSELWPYVVVLTKEKNLNFL